MERMTSLARDLTEAGAKAAYDKYIRKVLANKEILAWIMKHTVEEYRDCSVKDVIPFIEGTPEIRKVPLLSSRITGDMNEDKEPGEGTIFYDIRFHAFTPDKERIKLLLNIEAQKAEPSYDLVTRGVFYAARMISSQMDREFTAEDYGGLKKVYSIWLCMSPKADGRDTITEYRIRPNDLYGRYQGKARYDLMRIVMIRFGKETDASGSELIRMLGTLVSGGVEPEKKLEILEKEFGIEPTVELKGGLAHMCNWSEIVAEEAMERGLAQGMEQGMAQGMERGMAQGMERGLAQGMERGSAATLVNIVDSMMAKMDCSLADACELASATVEAYQSAKQLLS